MELYANQGRLVIRDNSIRLPRFSISNLTYDSEYTGKVEAIGCVDRGYHYVALYNEMTEDYSVSLEGKKFFLEDLDVQKNILSLTERIKKFLGVSKSLFFIGTNPAELWNQEEFMKLEERFYKKHGRKKFMDTINDACF